MYEQRESWSSIGWDLDGQCTVGGSVDTPCLPPEGGAAPPDGDDGSDNAFGRSVLPLLVDAFPEAQAEARRRMTESEPLLLHFREYNLGPTDMDVEATLVGTLRPVGIDGRTEARWDGEDYWVRNRETLTAREDPRVEDKSAWIEDGTFVLRIPERQPITLPWAAGRRVRLRLLGGVVTGVLTNFNGEEYRNVENVWIQGRLLLADLETLLDDAGVCVGNPLRDTVMTEARRHLDVDGLSSSPVCGAISVALSLEGMRAGRSIIEDPAPVPTCD